MQSYAHVLEPPVKLFTTLVKGVGTTLLIVLWIAYSTIALVATHSMIQDGLLTQSLVGVGLFLLAFIALGYIASRATASMTT